MGAWVTCACRWALGRRALAQGVVAAERILPWNDEPCLAGDVRLLPCFVCQSMGGQAQNSTRSQVARVPT